MNITPQVTKRTYKSQAKPKLEPAAQVLLTGLIAHGGVCTDENATAYVVSRLPDATHPHLAWHDLYDRKLITRTGVENTAVVTKKGMHYAQPGKRISVAPASVEGVMRKALRFKLAVNDVRFLDDYMKIRSLVNTGTSVSFIQTERGLEAVHVLAAGTEIEHAVNRCISRVSIRVPVHHIYVQETQAPSVRAQVEKLAGSEGLIEIHIHNEF